MKPPCEAIIQVLPIFRAMVAKKLIADYKFTQKKTASVLGMTQPAISQYKRGLRGYKTDGFEKNPNLREMVESLSKSIASEKENPMFFCDICKFMRENGLVCDTHKKMHPSLKSCSICIENGKEKC